MAAVLLLQNTMAKAGAKGGTSILHWMVTTKMVASGVESGVRGSVNANQNKQGNADNQRLTIAAAGLQSNATYLLVAVTVADTNPVVVADFPTNAKGVGLVKYVYKNNGKGNAGGTSLPVVLNPISDIQGLGIANGSTQTVLSADLTDPDKLQYLVSRSLTNDGIESGAAASLRIKATQKSVQFRLLASGLLATSGYFLAVNDVLDTNVTTDAAGNLSFNALPAGTPDVLDIHTLAILNSSSNSVLSTTLP
jgi:hypothetical protein